MCKHHFISLITVLCNACTLVAYDAQTRMFDIPDYPPRYEEGQPESVTVIKTDDGKETWDAYGVHDNRYTDPYPGSSQLPPALPPEPDYTHRNVTPPTRYHWVKKSPYDQTPQPPQDQQNKGPFDRTELSKRDRELFKKIDDAFYLETTSSRKPTGYMPFQNIQIDVQSGKVTLNGTVNTQWEKGRAESLVRQINGVTSVNNQLSIIPGGF